MTTDIESAYIRFKALCQRMESDGAGVSDAEAMAAYKAATSGWQTNCDAAAQGLFMLVSRMCALKPQLESQLLPDAIRPLYYLGVEDLPTIKKYLTWLVEYQTPYIERTTNHGYDYLRMLAGRDDTLIEAFRAMYEMEDNDWRVDDSEVDRVPLILR